jgi:hypothetical protein
LWASCAYQTAQLGHLKVKIDKGNNYCLEMASLG